VSALSRANILAPPPNKGLNLPKGTEEYALRAISINVPFAG
jgi:hypothetical protein